MERQFFEAVWVMEVNRVTVWDTEVILVMAWAWVMEAIQAMVWDMEVILVPSLWDMAAILSPSPPWIPSRLLLTYKKYITLERCLSGFKLSKD